MKANGTALHNTASKTMNHDFITMVGPGKHLDNTISSRIQASNRLLESSSCDQENQKDRNPPPNFA